MLKDLNNVFEKTRTYRFPIDKILMNTKKIKFRHPAGTLVWFIAINASTSSFAQGIPEALPDALRSVNSVDEILTASKTVKVETYSMTPNGTDETTQGVFYLKGLVYQTSQRRPLSFRSIESCSEDIELCKSVITLNDGYSQFLKRYGFDKPETVITRTPIDSIPHNIINRLPDSDPIVTTSPVKTARALIEDSSNNLAMLHLTKKNVTEDTTPVSESDMRALSKTGSKIESTPGDEFLFISRLSSKQTRTSEEEAEIKPVNFTANEEYVARDCAQSYVEITANKNYKFKGTVTNTTTKVYEGDFDRVTSIGRNGIGFAGRRYITIDGLNASLQKVQLVADGEVSPTSLDAVNGRQLYGVLEKIEAMAAPNVDHIGSLSAALAALHPLPYSEEHPWGVSVGGGRYRSSTAFALGVNYYLKENLRVQMGISYANTNNKMINVGVSYRFGDEKKPAVSLAQNELERQKAIIQARYNELQAERMQDAREIAKLKTELSSTKNKLEETQRELTALTAIVKDLQRNRRQQ